MENISIQPTGTVGQDRRATGCCDPFDPTPWQEKEVTWNNKLFVKDHVTSFLHIPLNMGNVVTRNMKLIEAAHADSPVQLMLSDEKSLWGADIYIDVAKDVPGAKMATISGTFLTKVFEGSFKNVGMWMHEMKEYVADKGKATQKLYCCYTTCPKCAKAYGKNYVVLFAQIN
ncbi:MAG: hydrolase [Candidatus Peribacter sp.]